MAPEIRVREAERDDHTERPQDLRDQRLRADDHEVLAREDPERGRRGEARGPQARIDRHPADEGHKPDDAHAGPDRRQNGGDTIPPRLRRGGGRRRGDADRLQHRADGHRLAVGRLQRVGHCRHHGGRKPGDRRDGVALDLDLERDLHRHAGRGAGVLERDRHDALFQFPSVGQRLLVEVRSPSHEAVDQLLVGDAQACRPARVVVHSAQRRPPDGAHAERLGDGTASACARCGRRHAPGWVLSVRRAGHDGVCSATTPRASSAADRATSPAPRQLIGALKRYRPTGWRAR
jgi:hypothetical protein